MSSYTTIQGDMWDLIAYKIYGNEHYMQKLMRANPKYIDMAIFPAGVTLTCPEIETIASVATVPWRE